MVNFGTILQLVTNKCVKNILSEETNEAKTLVKGFMSMVGMKEILNKQFKTYNRLTSSYVANRAMAVKFVNECLNVFDDTYFGDVVVYNKLLESKFLHGVKKIKSSKIDTDIDTLIRNKTDNGSVSPKRYVEAFERVVDNVNTIKEQKNQIESLSEIMKNSSIKFLKPKHVIRIALNKFNKENSCLKEEDRKMFYLLKDGSKKEIKNEHDNLTKKITSSLEHISDKIIKDKIRLAIKECKVCNEDSILNLYELAHEIENINKEKK